MRQLLEGTVYLVIALLPLLLAVPYLLCRETTPGIITEIVSRKINRNRFPFRHSKREWYPVGTPKYTHHPKVRFTLSGGEVERVSRMGSGKKGQEITVYYCKACPKIWYIDRDIHRRCCIFGVAFSLVFLVGFSAKALLG